MDFLCQRQAIEELKTLANSNSHSIMICGPEGSGKTYLAHEYSRMLGTTNYAVIQPSVSEIRSATESCIGTNSNMKFVICIENLDKGVLGASYTLLKFLEEPYDNIYVIVTCRNIRKIPSTIISRSVCVQACPPIYQDIQKYSMNKDEKRYNELKNNRLWRCIRTFSDADKVLKFDNNQIEYFNNLKSLMSFNDNVSNIVWTLGHFPDNSETPIELVLRYIMECSTSRHLHRCAIECINDISSGRIASHTVLTKFVFDAKYTE